MSDKSNLAARLSKITNKPELDKQRQQFLSALADTLKRKGIDPDDIGQIKNDIIRTIQNPVF